MGPTYQVIFYLRPETPRSTTVPPSVRSCRPTPEPYPLPQASPSINTPMPPPSSPFASPRVHRLATAKSLDGAPQTCRGLRPNSPSPVSSSLPSYPLYLALAHPPDHFPSSNLSQNDMLVITRGTSPRRRAPTILCSFLWKRSRSPSSPSNPSRRPDPSQSIAVVQEPPEPRRRPPPVCIAGGPRRNPSSNRWVPPSLVVAVWSRSSGSNRST
jgi:hypothetical protein